MNIGHGGTFMYPYECDFLRGIMYKKYNLDPSLNQHDILCVILITRHKNRHRAIINEQEIIDMYRMIDRNRLVY